VSRFVSAKQWQSEKILMTFLAVTGAMRIINPRVVCIRFRSLLRASNGLGGGAMHPYTSRLVTVSVMDFDPLSRCLSRAQPVLLATGLKRTTGDLRTYTWRRISQMNQMRCLSKVNDEYPQIIKFISGKTCVIEAGYACAAKRTRLI
jgi:hypothetical protein